MRSTITPTATEIPMTTTNFEYALPRTVSREEWRAARLALLAREKELTKARDVLNAQRRTLPMVEIEKEYAFDGPDGPARLVDLFDGRRQLIVYHFMFAPGQTEGCPGCSHMADCTPHLAHLRARDTSLVFVSRAPLADIEPFRVRMGWTTPWYSSFGSDFNYDFNATVDEDVLPVEHNYRTREEMEARGQRYSVRGEQPGVSVFVRDGDRVFHSYSTYSRGVDHMISTYNFLDLTPFGRGEGWDGMPNLEVPLRYHDSYDA